MGSRETHGRDYETLSNHSVISKIIESFLYQENVGIKGGLQEDQGIVTKIFGDSGIISVAFSNNLNPVLNERIFLQKTLKRHIELNCKVLTHVKNSEYTLQVESIHIAKANRREERIRIKNDSVFATNIVYHPKRFEIERHMSPNIIREILETFNKDLMHPKFGEIKVGLFERGQDVKFEIVRKTKKIFYIPNASKASSYTESLPQFVNYITYFGKNILSAIRKYKNEFITSELILPILYDKNDKDSIPRAYLWVRSKVEPILSEDLPGLFSLAEKIIAKIESSDSIKATNRFDILDISESGIRIKINQKNIIYNVYPSDSLKFDLVFKGKPPIHMNAKIRWRTMDKKGRLYLGLKFEQDKDLLPGLRKFEYNLQALRNKMRNEYSEALTFAKIYRSLNQKKKKAVTPKRDFL
ncbi:PilZ domain-containing protein [Leptospira langatensis]|uniref:PilZ domain-containing protein n=1 Tax=Leptospira langatensis TaxID=2484983 RepID=A0A5F1ZWR5_9LEPT|nr:PilZ domain-containing protein [Leptospira langatensis]TGJ98333.1 PilZ domain-containing protein [Leptospira langatensis]TGL43246.1 PilZ domain-containing protein [Leptospira langatensis]